MIEFLKKLENRGTKITRVNSILLPKSINLQLFTLIVCGVGGPLWLEEIFHAWKIFHERRFSWEEIGGDFPWDFPFMGKSMLHAKRNTILSSIQWMLDVCFCCFPQANKNKRLSKWQTKTNVFPSTLFPQANLSIFIISLYLTSV